MESVFGHNQVSCFSLPAIYFIIRSTGNNVAILFLPAFQCFDRIRGLPANIHIMHDLQSTNLNLKGNDDFLSQTQIMFSVATFSLLCTIYCQQIWQKSLYISLHYIHVIQVDDELNFVARNLFIVSRDGSYYTLQMFDYM